VHDNVSHTDLQPPSAERQKQLGMCSVCFRQLSITSSSIIHNHGLNGQCAESGRAPVDGSITVVKAPTYNSQHSQPASGDSSNSVIEMASDDVLHRLRDYMNNCRLLKRIPKATRTVAAKSWLSCPQLYIVANPDNMQVWSDLFLFLSCCLKDPGGRGSRKHQKQLAVLAK